MGNEMGNRNVSGLQEEDKAVGEEIEKNLARGDFEDEVNEENHAVPNVKDKDFHEKVDHSGGQVSEDGNSLQGQENESNELKLASNSAEMEVSKESDDDKPVLGSNIDGDTQTEDEVTSEKDTEKLEETGGTEKIVPSTIDSISSQEKVEIGILDPVSNLAEDQEPKLLEKKAAQEENRGKDANVDDEGENSFSAEDSAASSEEVIDPFSNELELLSNHQSLEEEKCEVACVGDEKIGSPLFGSLDSSQEFTEPLEKPTHPTQQPESLLKEKEEEEEKCETTKIAEKGIEPDQEPEMLVNEKAAQEEKCEASKEEFVVSPIGSQETTLEVDDPLHKLQEEIKHEVQCVDGTEIAFLPADLLDGQQASFEPEGKSTDLPQEGKYDDVNDSQIVIPSLASQEVFDIQEKTVGLTQESEVTVKEKATQEDKFISLENSSPIFDSIVPSQEVTIPAELAVAKQITPKDELIVKENETQEVKIVLEGDSSPIPGSTIPTQEVTVPTELTVTKQNTQVNKPATRKSPSFDFDRAVESRPSQDSDRTPLLSQDKVATRSLSSRDQQTYQYNKVPLEDEEELVEEKTIMMERSYSEKSSMSFMSLLRKEDKGSVENKNKTRNDDGNYRKDEEKVMLTSGKAKRKSSFFGICICCDV